MLNSLFDTLAHRSCSFVDRDMFARFLASQRALEVVDYSNARATAADVESPPEEAAMDVDAVKVSTDEHDGDGPEAANEADDSEYDSEADLEEKLDVDDAGSEAEEELDEVEVDADDADALGGVWEDFDDDGDDA
jgi:hypothetical protein